MDMYSLRLVNRFVTQYNKTPELVKITGMMKAEIIITTITEGREKHTGFDCWLHDLKQYNPEIYKKLQP
jgi:hypothetical protein